MTELKFADTPAVSWARVLETGGEGGVPAVQIDASGTSVRNYAIYEWTLPAGNAPSIMSTFRVKSTLLADNPAFEGFAVRIRGFDSNGNDVWQSDPSQKGRKAWYAVQNNDWVDANFIDAVPQDQGIVSVTFECFVRARGGQITFCKPTARHHYAVVHNLSETGTSLWTSGLSLETVTRETTGISRTLRWVRYVRTEPINIEEGKLVKAIVSGGVYARAFAELATDSNQGNAGDEIRTPVEVGVMIKMRKNYPDTEYDYFTVGLLRDDGNNNKYKFVSGSIDFIAKTRYKQVEVIPFGDPEYTPNSIRYGVNQLGTDSMELELIITDYVAPSQS